MKQNKKKDVLQKDDSLYGLLSAYKKYTTYVRVLVNTEDDIISVQITSNPKNWEAVDSEKYASFSAMRRIDLGSPKSLIKYISPDLLINITGPLLGIKIPTEKAEIINSLKDKGYYIIETSTVFKSEVIEGVSKILNMPPQKKYELLEKYMSDSQEKNDDRSAQ